MANWDIFHSERLEIERDLTAEAVRDGRARGAIRDDDLIRPAGTSNPWTRITDVAEVRATPKAAAEPPKAKPPAPDEREPPTYADAPPAAFFLSDEDDDDDEVVELTEAHFPGLAPGAGPEVAEAIMLPDDEDDDDEDDVLHVTAPPVLNVPPSHGREEFGEFDMDFHKREHKIDLGNIADGDSSAEVYRWDDGGDDVDPQEEDEAAADFTLSRKSSDTVEELDLAAMVDVAFQLVLFFLVTSTTILYKSLEVPKPNPETNAAATATEGKPKTLEDMKETFIVVEIDTAGAIKVDSEPIRADLNTIIETLRKARESTDRKAMLLSADFATPHKAAVLAYDAANEIGLSIAIARPTQGAKPNPPAGSGGG